MCTLEKRGHVYVLTLTGSGEHRLNPTLLTSIRSHLARIRSDTASDPNRPAALVTAAEGKFFSNGFDLAWAYSASTSAADRRRMTELHRRLVADLVSLPMPTVAAVTGHASAAGVILALSHDYLLMRADRGFLYMSEMDIGLKISMVDYFDKVLCAKIRDAGTRRDVLLRAAKMMAREGVRRGLVDRAVEGGVERVVEEAVKLAEEMAMRGWNGEVYKKVRLATMPEVWKVIGEEEGEVAQSKL
ncbi:enoyl-CoA delta isomerase 2, peroxisomal-like [Typha angustifolia]|uniref:enoyl-CoA delta isomerase 2, peroxisomal-like n=1 Tax=Typha angustifolia TaxID=59011 RepID=UPI003C30614A